MKRFYVTIALEVPDQSEEDLELNAVHYIKDDIEDNCLYIESIIEEEIK
jgi:hypothetical protein